MSPQVPTELSGTTVNLSIDVSVLAAESTRTGKIIVIVTEEISLVIEFAEPRRIFRRTAFAALVASAGAALVAPVAWADSPLNCTAADYAEVSSNVATAMASYLFAHPDVNAYITGLEAAGGDHSALAIADYESSHVDERADINAIRQPLADFDRRCGYGDHSRAQGSAQ